MSYIQQLLKVDFVDSHEAEVCIGAIEQLQKEGKDPAGYWLLYSGDLLTASRTWSKENGAPPKAMRSGLPDEGTYAVPSHDLGKGKDYYQQWVSQGDICHLVGGAMHHWGYFNGALCQERLREWCSEHNWRIEKEVIEGLFVTTLVAVVRSNRCPDARISVEVHGQGILEIKSSRNVFEDVATGYVLKKHSYVSWGSSIARQCLAFEVANPNGEIVTLNHSTGIKTHIELAKQGSSPYGWQWSAEAFLKAVEAIKLGG